MSTDPESRGGFGPYLEGVGPVYVDEEGEPQVIRYGVLEDVEHALRVHGQNVAAFLVEPIQGEAGCVRLARNKIRFADPPIVSWYRPKDTCKASPIFARNTTCFLSVTKSKQYVL